MKVQITGIAQINEILSVIAPREANNLLRATVYDMAKQIGQTAVTYTPDNPATGKGDLHTSIKPQREKGSRTSIEASVRVMNPRRNFFWRFLEYGDGPDHVEHAMFGKALEAVRPQIDQMYMRSFGAKLEARLAKLRKALL